MEDTETESFEDRIARLAAAEGLAPVAYLRAQSPPDPEFAEFLTANGPELRRIAASTEAFIAELQPARKAA